MKYSIILPYYNRVTQFRTSLEIFKLHYNDRNDFEFIIVEDYKNQQDNKLHTELLEVISEFPEYNFQLIPYYRHVCNNPAEMFNIGVTMSNGEYIILSNPEMVHETNILNAFDTILETDPNVYVVASVKLTTPVEILDNTIQYKFHSWQSHPKIQAFDHPYHYCSCMSKRNYIHIGGFDEEYVHGIACEDDDFVLNVHAHGIKFIFSDELIVLHQDHDVAYQDYDTKQQNKKLYNINFARLRTKWNRCNCGGFVYK